MNSISVSAFMLLFFTHEIGTKTALGKDKENGEVNGTPLSSSQDVDRENVYIHAYQDPNPVFTYKMENENQFLEARDCSDFFKHGHTSSGIYIIRPKGFPEPFHVYCDMEKDGGGWTVIQRRGDYGTPNDYFFRNWDDYKRGFGDLTGEFWLGNDKISAVTTQGKYRSKIDMLSSNWTYYTNIHKTFKVDNELEYYKLTVEEFVPSGIRDHMSFHNGHRFSTADRDTDMTSANCPTLKKGPWWYHSCYDINLNGVKDKNATKNYFRLNAFDDLRHSVMKIRPDNI